MFRTGESATFMNRGSIPPEDRHRPEPEIIPPARRDRGGRSGTTWTRLSIDETGVQRISVTRIAPLGMFGFWAMVTLGALALFTVFLGAVVLLVPVVAVLLLAGIITRFFRASSRRGF